MSRATEANSQIRLGKQFLTFLRLLGLSTITPSSYRMALAALIGRVSSPHKKNKIIPKNISLALNVSRDEADKQMRYWLEDQAISISMLYHFKSLKDDGWASKLINVDKPHLLEEMRTSKGLVLTAHCHYQNLVAAYLGKQCGRIFPLAVAPEESSLYPWIGRYIEKMNDESQQWFDNGMYIFLRNTRKMIQSMIDAFRKHSQVLALIDFNEKKTKKTTECYYKIFDQYFHPPLGAIRAALDNNVPIYLAYMFRENSFLTLSLDKIRRNNSPEEVVKTYGVFLEAHIKQHPHSWQGWEWWS